MTLRLHTFLAGLFALLMAVFTPAAVDSAVNSTDFRDSLSASIVRTVVGLAVVKDDLARADALEAQGTAAAIFEANKIRSKVFLEGELAILGIPGLVKGIASGGVKIVSTVKNTSASDVSKAIGNFAKDESGAVGKGGSKAQNSPIVPGGGLQAHEAAGGHLISRHVGKSDADLGARLNSQPKITVASSFPDRATAERAVSSALDANAANISQFLSGTGGRLVINHNVGSPVGNVMLRGASTSAPSSNVRVVIERNATMPTGYRIITGFPVP